MASDIGHLLSYINESIPWSIIFIAYIFIFIDMFYGVIVSIIRRETVSHKMLKGLRNKVFILFVPIIGILLKSFFVVCSLPTNWNGTDTIHSIFGVNNLSDFPICFLLCLFVIVMEFISFLETSTKLDSRAEKILRFIHKEVRKDDKVKDIIVDDK